MRQLIFAASIFYCLGGGFEPSNAAEELRPVTVPDIIEMTSLIDPDVKFSAYASQRTKVSPDGRHFFIITRTGNLSTGKNDYRLLVYKTAVVREFINEKEYSKKPEGRTIVEFSSSSNHLWEHAIRKAQWLSDSRTISFLGERGDQPTQVYTVNIETGAITQLTDHPKPVLFYDYDPNTRITVYASTEDVKNEDIEAASFVVGTRTINQVLFPYRSEIQIHRYRFFVSTGTESARGRPVGPAFAAVFPPANIAVSPDGLWAITRMPVTDEVREKEWAEAYAPIANNVFRRQQATTFDSSFMMLEDTPFMRFVLLDLRRGIAEPLLDAPDGYLSAGIAVQALWKSDGRSAILANTFLPLTSSDSEEIERRKAAPAIVELDLATRDLAWIDSLPTGTTSSSKAQNFAGIRMTPDDTLEVLWADGRPSTLYRKAGGKWTRLAGKLIPEYDNDTNIDLTIYQDANTSPDIRGYDPLSGRSKTVTNLNPDFKNLSFGTVRDFSWEDRSGRQWHGGLIYPPGFQETKRYPVLIQTYGYDSREFVIDGPRFISSAYAGQAIANMGMLVLLFPNISEGKGFRAELLVFQQGAEAAIEELDNRRLIDRSRVGLIGFSSTGKVVEHMITFSDYPFAAATIADAWSFSLFGYTSYLFGWVRPGMLAAENMMGAVPWGEDLGTWVERDPSLHIDRIKTPLRLENYDLWVYPRWDTYAIMRRLHKPVEMIVFPRGAHQLRRPWERRDSLQGNVDWFAFWLLDKEDPDPAKAEQYKRWRKLRELYQDGRRPDGPTNQTPSVSTPG